MWLVGGSVERAEKGAGLKEGLKQRGRGTEGKEAKGITIACFTCAVFFIALLGILLLKQICSLG